MKDTLFQNTERLVQAALDGDVAEVKRLIPISDPTFADNAALVSAVTENQYEVVCLLIPVSDPKLHNSSILDVAVRWGDARVVDLLYPVCDPQAALKSLQQDCDERVWGEFAKRVKADQEKMILIKEVGSSERIKPLRKI